ncbi:MAG: esterase-like activity of phytase family protein [Parvibaculum sp.]|uniref:esterase-like activity of phytase family protein n=1 Tax=Parvibaculum sp. TaxID=2024848 RepID=UPI0028481DCC|nr:esterase-like activity of phytase family protein [Parvibaculum sp.]MDR3497674.1 esterase-like activity of phytase family protein [Parvibaculum sp.]
MVFKRSLPDGDRCGLTRGRKSAAALALLTLLSVSFATVADAGTDKIDLSSHSVRWNPLNRNDTEAGAFEWAGTIEISSENEHFGGWSGLAVSADGSTLLAISDEARWLSAQILYDEKGRLSGIGDGKIAPMLGLDGKPIPNKNMGDAEGLAVDNIDPTRGHAYVSFERHHRIWRYDLGKGGFDARPTQIVTQRELGKLPTNEGIEALTVAAPETADTPASLIAFTENARDPRGNVRAFIIDGKKVRRFSMRLHDPNRPTDLARLPNGDFLLLERRFSLLAGAGMQIRQIKQEDVKPGAIVDGKVLLDADQRRVIDNMEGIAVRQDRKGDVWVYIISDDNFNPLQHTYLMMFRLKQEPDVTPPHILKQGE